MTTQGEHIENGLKALAKTTEKGLTDLSQSLDRISRALDRQTAFKIVQSFHGGHEYVLERMDDLMGH